MLCMFHMYVCFSFVLCTHFAYDCLMFLCYTQHYWLACFRRIKAPFEVLFLTNRDHVISSSENKQTI